MPQTNTNKPLISVIVPVYNCAAYLPQCIESLSAQTYRHLQIILVDDGSKDGSGEICDKYAAKDARITVIHQANAGVSAARNAGLKAARGEYIGFADGDDYAATELYEYLYGLICKYDTKISVCNYYEVHEKQSKVCPDSPTREHKFSAEEALFRLLRMLSVWHQLFHREMFDHISFDENMSYAEDLYVSFQAFVNAGAIAYGPKPLYYYRRHEASVTKSFKWNPKHLGYITVSDDILAYAQAHQCQELYLSLRNAQLNMLASFLRDCLLQEPADKKSARTLCGYFQKHIKEFITANVKLPKKMFVLCCLVNLRAAKIFYIWMGRNKRRK